MPFSDFEARLRRAGDLIRDLELSRVPNLRNRISRFATLAATTYSGYLADEEGIIAFGCPYPIPTTLNVHSSYAYVPDFTIDWYPTAGVWAGCVLVPSGAGRGVRTDCSTTDMTGALSTPRIFQLTPAGGGINRLAAFKCPSGGGSFIFPKRVDTCPGDPSSATPFGPATGGTGDPVTATQTSTSVGVVTCSPLEIHASMPDMFVTGAPNEVLTITS